jgi:DNA-binding GntR family transcriptional regulator
MEHAQQEYQAFNAKDEGYQRFLKALREGDIGPGSKVTQTDLCDILKMSVTPLRECLVLLEEYGLVEVRPRAGVRIVYPDISFFRENMQFRTIIESNALPSFVEKAEPEFLLSLRKTHEECRERCRTIDDFISIYPEELHSLDTSLHAGIVEALQNKSISAAHIRLHDNLSICKLVHIQRTYRRDLLDTIDEHLVLIDAMLERNIDVALDALNAHLRASTYRTFT